MTKLIKRFWRGDEGATMVEYGLMVALIAIVCVAAVMAIGTELNIVWGKVLSGLQSAS